MRESIVCHRGGHRCRHKHSKSSTSCRGEIESFWCKFLEGKRMAQTLAAGSFYCRVAPESFESVFNMSNRLALLSRFKQRKTALHQFIPMPSIPWALSKRPCHSLTRIKKHYAAMIHLIQCHSARPQRIPHRSLPVIFAVEQSKRSASIITLT